MALLDYLSNRRDEIEAQIKALRAELSEIKIAEAALGGQAVTKTVVTSPRGPSIIREGSIKDWILRALALAPGGLYTDAVMKVIRDQGGPLVPRSSITPQLSRLKAEELIEYREGTWRLLPQNNQNKASDGYQPPDALADDESIGDVV